MKPQEIAWTLAEKFGPAVLESQPETLNPWSAIEPSALLDVCRFLRSDEALQMDHLELLGGVDYKDRIEVVYVLYSMKHRHRYTLKCRLSRENPIVPTVESVWGVANWHERETFDMLGVVFEGHSDLRRILCPDDWEGYPLRKDYEPPKIYREMPV
ncbi:MAG: NADH-quinone oxidoreductase subunit C [Acidobacteriota bacterium]|jgi:NADH-quinone oxidoreductase subunit C|nr:NADH-quinone oxidoreductase subunit C [Acidobacteriota bacterium]